MIEKFYQSFDKVEAPKSAVDQALSGALSAEASDAVIDFMPKKRRKAFISAVAAALVILITLGILLIPRHGSERLSGHSFTITANAAEIGDKFGSKVIGAFGCTGMPLWSPWQQGDERKFVMSADLSTLHIEGEDIKSVTMRTNVEGTYFMITPTPALETRPFDPAVDQLDNCVLWFIDEPVVVTNFDSEEELMAAMKEEGKKYTDVSFINTDFSKNDIYERLGGAEDYAMLGDTFTYQNIDGSNPVAIDHSLQLYTEFTKSDEAIEKMISQYDMLGLKMLGAYRNSDMPDWSDEQWENAQPQELTTPEMEEVEKQMEALSGKILEHLLDGEIIIDVTFNDGTVESKALTLGVGYLDDNPEKPYLTLSE